MTPNEPMHLIVIGASAGGIEALGIMLGGLPRDFPAPIIIAQHIDPERPSHLAEILSRCGALQVQLIAGREELRPGVVFVVPPNRDVEITSDHVTLREDTTDRPKPSVNRLFSSAAATFGETLIAVVLSGTGSDGAVGARSVKEQGGMVIIQNPSTAKYPGMPASLSPSMVDIVADADRIGPLLNDLLTGTYVAPPPKSDRQLQPLLEEVQEHTGIDFSMYKMPTIQRRLKRRMAVTETRTLADYAAYLETHPEEYDRLVSAFLIKVTEFFRDPELFAYLRDDVIPAVVAEARKTDREIRVWSAGCSTGEEAYSVAILLAEALGDEINQFRVRVFATDLDEAAVANARRGSYPRSAMANIAPDLVSRYFIEAAGEYAVRSSLRRLVIFGQHDLGQRPPFPQTDLILCRNVLMYFTSALQKRALQLFAFSLRDGGYLVLGKAETISPLADLFAPDNSRLKVFRRHGPRRPVPPFPAGPVLPIAIGERPERRVPSTTERNLTKTAAVDGVRRAVLEELDAVFLNLPVGLVVIDRAYDIQHINTEARTLLGIYGPAIGDDFVHLANRLPSRELRATIDKAFREEGVARIAEIRIGNPGPAPSRHYVDLICSPHPAARGAAEMVSILISDVTDRVVDRQKHDEEMAGQRQQLEATVSTLAAEVQLLTEANTELLTANEQLTSVNLQLRTANDEALIWTEQALASSEEVETLNEEFQASNEELETVNEELQATVEELTTRSDQLAQMATARDEQWRAAEQARQDLELAFTAIPAAVLVVDSHGKPALSNQRYVDIFGAADAEFRAEDRDGRPLTRGDSPQARAAQGESFEMEFTVRLDGHRRSFQASGSPLPSQSKGVSGRGLILIREVGFATDWEGRFPAT